MSAAAVGLVVARALWGARHDDGAADVPEPADEAWLHHSVTLAPDLVYVDANGDRVDDDEAAAARHIENIGEQRFGRGASYNRLVMPRGVIYAGVSWNRRGAHTGGRNTRSRSWVLVGDYDRHEVTDAQVEAIAVDLVRAWRGGHLLRPRLNGGHQDAPGASTACPGRYGMAAIPRINARAAAIAAGAPTAPGRPVEGTDSRKDEPMGMLIARLKRGPAHLLMLYPSGVAHVGIKSQAQLDGLRKSGVPIFDQLDDEQWERLHKVRQP